jgi:hypothetical protein
MISHISINTNKGEVPGVAPRARPAELRCHCGSLLARAVAGGVELKCRRCKRTWVLPLEAKGTTPR